jgi:hypothetical protein
MDMDEIQKFSIKEICQLCHDTHFHLSQDALSSKEALVHHVAQYANSEQISAFHGQLSLKRRNQEQDLVSRSVCQHTEQYTHRWMCFQT